jgi:ribose 5-phosphate isomerase RpiB
MATASTEDIQRIVREVMAQLGAASKNVTAPVPAAPADTSLVVGLAVRNDNVFVDSRVVTLESIAGRLQGAKQLTVPPGALVTPAVCDELRRKGVALVRGSMAATVRKGPHCVVLVVGPARHDPATVVQTLADEGIDVQTETSDCMIASTDKLAAAVATGQALGLLWTRHTAVGLCLANRHAGVRAVLANGVTATAAAVAAVGANVLVVDPAVGTAYEKKQLLRDFCLGGIRQCPEALKERLEK